MNYTLNDLHILYIEDELTTRELLTDTLKILCKKVTSVETAEEALVIYKNDMPDIIISDVDLPGISGIEFVKEIRKNNKIIPIILLTAHSEVNYLMDAVKLHLIDYIIKPVDVKKLTITLKESARQILDNGKFSIKFISGALYNIDNKTILYNSKEYLLTHHENLLLELLLKNRNKNTTTVEIFDNVWEYDEGTESALKSLLNKLRKKIGKESIINISGIGYRIILS